MFNDDMLRKAREKLTLEKQLRHGLANQEFFVEYQPILDLKTGRLTDFEALVRWQCPERGLVTPAEFLPLAEETGLIVELGEAVLRQSCQQLSQWRATYGGSIADFSVSVNLSAVQIRSEAFPALLEEILAANQLKPSDINIEITESMMLDNQVDTEAFFKLMRERGHGLMLDDFGTGYSSLSYLHRFKVDTLKIDRSFVKAIDSDRNSRAIVKAVLALADALEIEVIAEGVETAAHEACLRKMNCQKVQGFYYSKPMTPQKAAEYLESRMTGNSLPDGPAPAI